MKMLLHSIACLGLASRQLLTPSTPPLIVRTPSAAPHLLIVRTMGSRRSPASLTMCDGGSGDDFLPALVVADVTLTLAFTFSRTLAQILSSPSFAGWLAPVSLEPGRFEATMAFAGECSLLWVAAGFLVRGYALSSNANGAEAARTAGLTSAGFICGFLLLGLAGVQPLSIDQVGAACGLALGLSAWRWSYGSAENWW